MTVVRLGELGAVITGTTPPSKERHLYGSDVPFLTPTDMSFDNRHVATGRGLSALGASRFESRMVPSRSVAVVCIGATIGKVCMTDRPTLTNQQINTIVVDETRHCPEYVYYLLRTMGDHLQSIAGGAATPIINKGTFTRVNVDVPALSTQTRVAKALGSFDDLIENNLRRIEILEEMARLIYREWFVHFRFPGHEDVGLVDSDLGPIPEGWDVCPLEEVLDVLESGSRPPGGVGDLAEGVASIGAENVLGLGRHEYSKEKYIDRSFFEKMRRGKVSSGDVLLYKDGAYIGRTSLVGKGFPHEEAAINEHVFRLRAEERLSQSFLYFWLSDPGTNQRVRSLNSNAAQPGISQEKLKTLRLAVPRREQIEQLDVIVQPMVNLALNLAVQGRLLGRFRDLLLPRLISGDLVVSEVNLHLDPVA